MLVTKHFVYLHMMKTGGHWVRDLIMKTKPRSWDPVVNQIGKHQHRPYTTIPEGYRHLPVIAVCRNPWDWWVSKFFFVRQKPPPMQRHHWIRKLPNSVEGFERALPRMMAEMFPTPYQWDFLRGEDGLLPPNMKLVRFETLRDGLKQAFLDCGAEVPPRMEAAFAAMPPRNVTRHEHYSVYYRDSNLRESVRKHDQWIIDQAGYVFEAVS